MNSGKIGQLGFGACLAMAGLALVPMMASADQNIQGNNGDNSPCCMNHDNSVNTGAQGVAQHDNSLAVTGSNSQALHDNSAGANGAGANAMNNLQNNAVSGSGGQAFQQANNLAAVNGTGAQGFENANNFGASNGTDSQAFNNVHDFAASTDHSVSLNNTQPGTVVGLASGTAVASTVLAANVTGTTFNLGGSSGLASSGPPAVTNAMGASAFSGAAGITQVAQSVATGSVQQNVTMQANMPALSNVTGAGTLRAQ
jgi:hypothetical protein